MKNLGLIILTIGLVIIIILVGFRTDNENSCEEKINIEDRIIEKEELRFASIQRIK